MRFVMTPGGRVALDAAMVVGVAGLGAAAIVLVYMDRAQYLPVALVSILAVVAVAAVYSRTVARPDHVRAMQSHHLLVIANGTLADLRKGLTSQTAQLVCRLALQETEAAAVAITDRESVLGFAGVAEDHHTAGGPIITRATHEALKHNEHRILSTQEEIGCPKKDCKLQAAIVVPLRVRDTPVGTLKFYYTTPRLLNENQLTMVEGLAQLLSTQLESSELDRQTELATRMELKALQAQIDPHFLFNTINTIASMIRTDAPRARELLREFASLYRHVLENNTELISLECELDYVRRYLVFEKARFGEDAISLTEDVAESLLGVQIPAFALQPLVENAVQHGLVTGRRLNIAVTAREDTDGLTISVSDDGRGMEPDAVERVMEPGFGTGLGIALKNVHDRLRGHFGPDSGLRLTSSPGEGTTVAVVIGKQDRTSLEDSGA